MSDLPVSFQGPPVTHAGGLAFLFAYIELLGASWASPRPRASHGKHEVTVARLRAQGMTDEGLVWMLYHAHLRHRAPGAPSAAWPVESTRLGERSTLSLTAAGVTFADRFLAQALLPADGAERDGLRGVFRLDRLVPSYDAERRVFRWGQHVLKRFRQPSPSQEMVLCTAEELGWPTWFDDPLPRGRGNAKRRLHDTIKDLNRRQKPYLVHFRGDGTGTRIGWELR